MSSLQISKKSGVDALCVVVAAIPSSLSPSACAVLLLLVLLVLSASSVLLNFGGHFQLVEVVLVQLVLAFGLVPILCP